MRYNKLTVIHRLSSDYNLSILPNEIDHFLESHPEFPSLTAICDTLDQFGIENTAVQVEDVAELETISNSFLSYLQYEGFLQLVYIKSLRDIVKFYDQNGRLKTISKEKFKEGFAGYCVLINSEKQKPTFKSITYPISLAWSNPQRQLAFLISFILLISFSLYGAFEPDHIVWYFTKIIGIILAGLLLSKDFGSHSFFDKKFCRAGNKVDCDSVLNSQYATVLNVFKLSEVGFVYFVSSLLLIVYTSELQLAILLSAVSSLYILVSLYQQVFLIRKYCTYCLTVLAVLAIELSYAIYLWDDSYLMAENLWNDLVIFLGIASAVYTLVLLIKSYHNNGELAITYERIKNTAEVKLALLKRNKRYHQLVKERPFLRHLGNGSGSTIQVIFSLDCDHCRALFLDNQNLFNPLSENRFNVELIPVFEKGNTEQLQFICEYFSLLSTDKKSAFQALLAWFNKEFDSGKDLNQSIASLSNDHKTVVWNYQKEVFQNRIDKFPWVAVNGYQIPEVYQLKDFVEDTVFLELIVQNDEKYINHKELVDWDK